jgi:hypothetical protein
MRITRALAVIPVTAAALALASAPAWADSPHFLAAANTVSADTGALTTTFKDAGLGTGTSSIQVTLTVGTATAVYQCWNNGGNHPQAGNKETVVTSLSVTGTFPVRNGQTTGSLTAGPPGPGTFACPAGQSLYLQSADYSGITVSDATGNSSPATPDPIGTGPVHIPA